MFKRKRLACSFCGKDASEVSKLVAGPRVLICDACVAEASRIMSGPGTGEAPRPRKARNPWRRVARWFGRDGIGRNADAQAAPGL